MKYNRKCKFCGKRFKTNHYRKIYCSIKCQVKHNHLARYTTCKICGEKMMKGSKRCRNCFKKKKWGSLSRLNIIK